MTVIQGNVAKLIQDGISELKEQLDAGTYPIPSIADLSKYPTHTRVREVNFLKLHKLLTDEELTTYRQNLGIIGMDGRFGCRVDI